MRGVWFIAGVVAALARPLDAAAQQAVSSGQWSRTVTIDAGGVRTEEQFRDLLRGEGVETTGYVNYFTGRWPNISFIGGMAMGNVSEHLEFFYEQPFRWSSRVLDYVMEGGGRRYGIRATIRRYKDASPAAGHRSFLLWYRCDALLADYHPSYILANGRRVWDCKRHPLLDGKILVPFSQEGAGDPTIDFVVDLDYTPEVKGLAFRMFNTQYLGDPGVRVDLKGAGDAPETSPADASRRFAFGVFRSGYDFWSDRGAAIADLKAEWKPNFRPAYPTDDLRLSPFIGDERAAGPYHDFMVTYGGCNVLGADPPAAILQAAGSYARGALAKPQDGEAARKVLGLGPRFEAHWFGGEEGLLAGEERGDDRDRLARLAAERQKVEAAKRASGSPDRVRLIHEPFPPALSAAYEYERGRDILVLKNEEDPQYNILMAMGRGAGRSFGKPFGFYWEQTHYPLPSLDFKLQACLLFFLSGGSWIGAEAENAPSFAKGAVAEWVMPYVQALRFAMVHPARGTAITPIGICWGYGDRWWAPYNPFGQMDTFVRSIEYDHAAGRITTEPTFVRPLPWMPLDRRDWSFARSGHLAYFADHIDELRGYDLLDVFFPQCGDAFTAHIARLLTGTPYGPVDFVYSDEAPLAMLRTYGALAFLGHATLSKQLAADLAAAAERGSVVVLGAQHLRGAAGSLPGLRLLPDGPAPRAGLVGGSADVYGKLALGSYAGKVHRAEATGWEPVAWIGPDRVPLVVRRAVGKGVIYVFLGEWMGGGGAVLRPVLREAGKRAAPLAFSPALDQMEYVAYRKGAGAWVALLNHGAIPVGCDRLEKPRAIPPEPLCSTVLGPWTGEVGFRLDRLGLDSAARYELYEVDGIDGPAFAQVISGRTPFRVRRVPSTLRSGMLRAHVTVSKRAEYVVAPPGQGEAVFFGAGAPAR